MALEGIYKTMVNFQMPGIGIPGFLRRSIDIAKAGVYNLHIHHDRVLVPLIEQWGIASMEGLSAKASELQEKLMELPAQIMAKAERFEARYRHVSQRPIPGSSGRLRVEGGNPGGSRLGQLIIDRPPVALLGETPPFLFAVVALVLTGCTPSASTTTIPVNHRQPRRRRPGRSTTSSETTATTLPPGTEELPEGLREEIARLIPIAEEIRGLEFLSPPEITVLTPEELQTGWSTKCSRTMSTMKSTRPSTSSWAWFPPTSNCSRRCCRSTERPSPAITTATPASWW